MAAESLCGLWQHYVAAHQKRALELEPGRRDGVILTLTLEDGRRYRVYSRCAYQAYAALYRALHAELGLE
jgi:hypothetical protein